MRKIGRKLNAAFENDMSKLRKKQEICEHVQNNLKYNKKTHVNILRLLLRIDEKPINEEHLLNEKE